MPKSKYVDLYDVNELQRNIMKFVDNWVRTEKTPIPQSEIVKAMTEAGTKNFTTVNAINSLLRKGYIRRAIITSNKTYYVQLRRIN